MNRARVYSWGIMGNIIPQFIYLIATMILSRILSPEDFGTIGVLTIFLIIAQTLTDSGLGGSLIKEERLSNVDCSTISVFNISVSVVLYLLIFISSDFIETYFNIKGLSNVTRILCIVFIINSFSLVPKSLMMKQLKFKELFYTYTISVLLAAFFSIILAFLSFGVYALVAYQLIYSLCVLICSLLYTKYTFSFSFSKESFIRLMPFGVFTTLSNVIDSVYDNLLSVIIGRYVGVQDVGYFTQAKRVEEVPCKSLVTAINGVVFPILTRITNKPQFYNEANIILRIIMLIISPLLLLIAIFSKEVIWFLFGEQWIDASWYLSILMIAGLFLILESLNRNFIKSYGNVRQLFYITILKRIMGIAILLGSIFFSVDYLLYAYVVSTAIAYICNCILFSRIFSVSIFRQIWLDIRNIIPAIAFVLLLIFMRIIFNSTAIIIVSSAVLLIIYYFLIIKYNTDILPYLKK